MFYDILWIRCYLWFTYYDGNILKSEGNMFRLLFLISLICVSLMSCSKDNMKNERDTSKTTTDTIQNMPVSKNNLKPFEWRLDELDWTKETTYIDQCFEILRRIDFEIHKIDEARKFYGVRYNSKEYADFLNVRIITLYYLHTLSPPNYYMPDIDKE